jgi:Adenylate and Guanylate cyclase catalytic domain/FtsX-like permease family
VTVTVLMSDIRSYSAIAEHADPSQLAGQLNTHRAAMNQAILGQEGTVMQFVGDAVMAVFGAPFPQPDHADRAVVAALAMHALQAEINSRWRAGGLPPFGLGLGLSTGEAAAALLGSAERLEYARPIAAESIPVFPSAVAIDLAPGTSGARRARLVERIVSANPDGTPGGSYELTHARASAVVNAEQMGGQPLALAVGLAAAALLSLALTILSLVRRRRRELALLKTLGMTRGQVRAVIAWQTTVTLLIAVAVGGPLGIAAGRLAWHAFARSLGVVPVVEVPVPVLVFGLAGLVLVGNLLAALPAAVAARTRPGASLRAE